MLKSTSTGDPKPPNFMAPSEKRRQLLHLTPRLSEQALTTMAEYASVGEEMAHISLSAR